MSPSWQRPVVALLESAAAVRQLATGRLVVDGTPFEPCAVEVVVDSWDAQQAAKSLGLAFRLVDEVLDSRLAEEANHTVRVLRSGWSTAGGLDFTLFEGISLASLFEYELAYTVLFPLARTVCAATTVVRERQPGFLLCDAVSGG